MRIGLIDADAESRGKVTFPNLALMKIAAWHKSRGDTVEWYMPLLSGQMDKVYVSKVFGDEYTKDYMWPIDADEVVRGGSGYAIRVIDGHEVYDKALDPPLPPEIECMTPDYSIYEIADTAYGYLTRGCPRGCAFCHVKEMQGRKVHTVARLSDFWAGQGKIVLLDPNLTASRDWDMHIRDLADSGAKVDFSQGLDLRLMTDAKVATLNRVKWERIHFAWDRPQDDLRGELVRVMSGLARARKETITVYVLTNYDSTHDQDMVRVQAIREAGATPYVMVYRKNTAPRVTRMLQRWCNAPMIMGACSFDEYVNNGGRV